MSRERERGGGGYEREIVESLAEVALGLEVAGEVEESDGVGDAAGEGGAGGLLGIGDGIEGGGGRDGGGRAEEEDGEREGKQEASPSPSPACYWEKGEDFGFGGWRGVEEAGEGRTVTSSRGSHCRLAAIQ